MTTLSSFKSTNNLGNIQFYPSTKGTGRHVGSANGITLVTVADFNPSKPAFVADDPKGDPKLFFLTNKNSVAAFEL